MTSDADTALVESLCRKIHPILAGQPPEIQGAVLAELLATYFAGFQDAGLRAMLLAHHDKFVREMIELEVNFRQMRR